MNEYQVEKLAPTGRVKGTRMKHMESLLSDVQRYDETNDLLSLAEDKDE